MAWHGPEPLDRMNGSKLASVSHPNDDDDHSGSEFWDPAGKPGGRCSSQEVGRWVMDFANHVMHVDVVQD